jgi:branched-chain amino acid transport system permease protein
MSGGRWVPGIAAGCAALAMLALAPLVLAPAGIAALTLWAVTAIAALGLLPVLALTGQVSLAQGAFVGIGACVAAASSARGWPFAAAVAAGAVACLAAAWAVGTPAMRAQRRDLFPAATLGFAVLAHLALRDLAWPAVTGPHMPGPRALYYLCLAALSLAVLGVWWIGRSGWGRACLALRTDPVRAAAIGVDVPRYRLAAFVIGAGLGGLAGALLAALPPPAEAARFAPEYSLYLLLLAILGGSGSPLGPLLGAGVAMALQAWLGLGSGPLLILLAAIGVAMLAFCPSGLIGMGRRLLPVGTEEGAR